MYMAEYRLNLALASNWLAVKVILYLKSTTNKYTLSSSQSKSQWDEDPSWFVFLFSFFPTVPITFLWALTFPLYGRPGLNCLRVSLEYLMSMSCLWTGVESSNVACLLPSTLVTEAQMLTVPLKWSATSKGIMSLTHRLKFAEPLIWQQKRCNQVQQDMYNFGVRVWSLTS